MTQEKMAPITRSTSKFDLTMEQEMETREVYSATPQYSNEDIMNTILQKLQDMERRINDIHTSSNSHQHFEPSTRHTTISTIPSEDTEQQITTQAVKAIESIQKFSGHTDDYICWKNTFSTFILKQTYPVTVKYEALSRATFHLRKNATKALIR